MDFYKLRKKLVREYQQAGGRNAREFMRGIIALEDCLASDYGQQPLNMDVPESCCIRQLTEKVDALTLENEQLRQELADKRHIIKGYRTMNKEERKNFRYSSKYQDMECTFTRMLQDILSQKDNGG